MLDTGKLQRVMNATWERRIKWKYSTYMLSKEADMLSAILIECYMQANYKGKWMLPENLV